MSAFATSSQAVFCMTVAVAAAALADPLVEGLSNAGLFGPGNFTDHSNLDVVPALTVGCALLLAYICLAAWRLLKGRHTAPGWLRDSVVDLDARSAMSLVPWAFLMQLLVLFSMETLEQIAVAGHPLGPTIWLGGPIAISLAVHALFCVTVTCCLSNAVRHCARTLAHVVSFFVQTFAALADSQSPRRSRRVEISPAIFTEPLLARLLGRAPPLPV